MSGLDRARTRMIHAHLVEQGIVDPAILEAFRSVPRERFVPGDLVESAYDDAPLPIAEGQTISQPYIVALTVEALQLEGGERVLEIGTGSGYAAAILSRLTKEVYSVERLAGLAATASERLRRLGYTNVHVLHGDGSLGWKEHAPYDAIAVSAGGPRVPEALVEQLVIGGRLVIPVGPDERDQVLWRITRLSETKVRKEPITDVTFVPLIGAQGWQQAPRLVRAAGLSLRMPTTIGLVH